MKNDQILKFEVAMEKFKNEQRNSSNGEMMGIITSERDRQLKVILSCEQLKFMKSRIRVIENKFFITGIQ